MTLGNNYMHAEDISDACASLILKRFKYTHARKTR